MAARDPTERFSDRVDDYVRHRPSYPVAMLYWLQHEHGVRSDWRVADVGAGTGISSRIFLDAGHKVVAVEPNAPMRAVAEAAFSKESRFRAVSGSAEHTGLADASIDLVSAAQAFHWFDPIATRGEWSRILRSHGLAAVYWNTRRLVGTPFLVGYEKLLHEYGTDYVSVAERYASDAKMIAWFGTGFRGAAKFEQAQRLDFDALVGRTLSSSYVPRAGHPRHEPLLSALRELFDATQIGGQVGFDYDTRIFVGAL